jgi:hypothetical protein
MYKRAPMYNNPVYNVMLLVRLHPTLGTRQRTIIDNKTKKAFDTIEWSFIKSALYGFGPVFQIMD